MRPTNRSVIARQRYISFDGGCREDSLCNATSISVFPRVAVIAKRTYIAEKKYQCFPEEGIAQNRN